MKNQKSLLYADTINIKEKFRIRIPTVGEILEDEQAYYKWTASFFTESLTKS